MAEVKFKRWQNIEGGEIIRRILLTFHMEDFINIRSLKAYAEVLNLLEKYDFRALFFITGHMAEKLSHFPQILKLLESHEIGYHSSSHSVRPIIMEYTDVENREKAYLASIRRETAHVDPLTGEVEGVGGLEFLRNLFPNKNIVSFRAPGSSWSPPHLEALKKLGIKFDFSAHISPRPAYHRGITFYPYPITIDGLLIYSRILPLLNSGITVLAGHPSFFVNSEFWDFAYYKSKPLRLLEARPRSRLGSEFLARDFELLLKQVKLLERAKLVETTPYLSQSGENLKTTRKSVEMCYEKSVMWARDFIGYEPKFLHSCFFDYFNIG